MKRIGTLCFATWLVALAPGFAQDGMGGMGGGQNGMSQGSGGRMGMMGEKGLGPLNKCCPNGTPCRCTKGG